MLHGRTSRWTPGQLFPAFHWPANLQFYLCIFKHHLPKYAQVQQRCGSCSAIGSAAELAVQPDPETSARDHHHHHVDVRLPELLRGRVHVPQYGDYTERHQHLHGHLHHLCQLPAAGR